MTDREGRIHLGICLPSMGTHLTETALSILAMGVVNENNGIYQSIFNQQQASVSCCRNLIVKDVLDAGIVDYTLWVDADMAFNPDLAVRLLHHNVDIVGASYPQRLPPYHTNGRFKEEFRAGLIETEFMPFGAMLVKTEVFRQIPSPWFFESYRFEGSSCNQMIKALSCAVNVDLAPEFELDMATLIEKHYPEGREGATRVTGLRGEDANFCREARRAGYKVWCDCDLTMGMVHIGKQCVSLGGSLPGMPVGRPAEKLSTENENN
jgi:hypothetical protein